MTVNRLLYIADDGTLAIDGIDLLDIDREYFDWIPSNVHAVQWYGDDIGGEIEYKSTNPISGDKPPNEKISELGVWEKLIQIHADEIERRAEAKRIRLELEEASKDYWQIFRDIRNYKLMECDWTQLPNSPLTQKQVDAWAQYRQELRDLTDVIDDPKPLVIAFESGEIHPDWPIPPQ